MTPIDALCILEQDIKSNLGILSNGGEWKNNIAAVVFSFNRMAETSTHPTICSELATLTMNFPNILPFLPDHHIFHLLPITTPPMHKEKWIERMAVAGWLMKEENQRLGSKIVLLTDDISSPGWYAADDSSIQIATSSTTSYFTSPHNFLDRELQTYVPGECPRLSNPCTLWSHNTRELTSEGATHFLNKLLEGLLSLIHI